MKGAVSVSSFTARVREAARKAGAGAASFSASDLEEHVGLESYAERVKLRECIRHLIRRAEIKRVAKGTYQFLAVPQAKPQKQLVMWRFLRMQKTVTIEDLQEIAEVSKDYAQEWLRLLVGRRIVRDHGNGNFQLIKDTLDMPVNDAKAERLRKIRQKQKETALKLIGEARQALQSLDQVIETWAD